MSLLSRMDNRSVEDFKKQISFGHFVENVLGEAYRLQIESTFKTSCIIQDIGVDNTGKVIDGNLPFHDVDKKFVWDKNSIRVEIKTAPSYLKDFFTFKVSSLKTCVSKNSIILLFARYDPTSYYLISPENCKNLIEKFPHKIYPKFSPNDKAIRIKYFEYKDFLDGPYKWCKKSLEYINDNKGILKNE